MITQKAITIILVEDDPGHARLIEKNLKRIRIIDKIIILENGKEALNYIFSRTECRDRRALYPCILLLDLNLPVLDGFQVLKRIKEDNRTKQFPVIMLTTTDSPTEISKCYELGCNIYITKPLNYQEFSETIRNIGLLLSIVKFPDGSEINVKT